MITRDDAEALVARWAVTETARRGYDLVPMVEEFDLGFVVWTREPPDVVAEPGDGSRSVIDKRTGRISAYPVLPIPVVIESYRRDNATAPTAPMTADEEVHLRRAASRSTSPGVAAHLTLAHDPRLRRAFGAKGDQELNHHHLLRTWLQDQDQGHLVRGAARHAELIVLSDALHEADAEAAATGRPLLDLPAARGLFSGRHLEFFHIREPGDPLGGKPAWPCDTCLKAYVQFGVLRADFVPPPEPGQRPGRQRRPGSALWVRPFTIDLNGTFPAPEACAGFTATIGLPVDAIGHEDNDSVIVVDARGRFFALDQAGEWFLGEGADAAFATLTAGAPQPRLHDDGTW